MFRTAQASQAQHVCLQDGISLELLQQIREYGPELNRATSAAAEVDCLIALALSASQHNLHCPKLTEDNVIHIEKGERPFMMP